MSTSDFPTGETARTGESWAADAPKTRELFALLGERWNYAILREVFFGVQRFGALQRNLQVAPTTLTARLTGLVKLGLLERRQYRPDKEWFDYCLTDSARELVPAWIMLAQWALTHMDSDRATTRQVRHTACGELISAQLTCSHCGGALEGRDLEPVEKATDDATPFELECLPPGRG